MKYELQQVCVLNVVGVDVENIPDEEWDTILISDDKGELLDKFIQALNGEQTCSLETYFRIVENKDG